MNAGEYWRTDMKRCASLVIIFAKDVHGSIIFDEQVRGLVSPDFHLYFFVNFPFSVFRSAVVFACFFFFGMEKEH